MGINQLEFLKGILLVMWNLLWRLWPIWVFLVGVLFIRIMIEIILPNKFKKLRNVMRFNKGTQWRKGQEFLTWLRGMKPRDFEEYIAELFRKLGYKTRVVGGSYDGGIDVIAEKDGVKHYIQCKKFITSQVGVGDIRNFYGALADKLAEGKGYFITTNKFTLEAERFAEDKPIELIDGFKLIEYIHLAELKNKETKKEKIKENRE